MVTAALHSSNGKGVRWLGYLTLSVLLNLVIISFVDLSRLPDRISVPPQFRISFKALASPASVPAVSSQKEAGAPVEVENSVLTPAIVAVVTKRSAIAQIAKSKPVFRAPEQKTIDNVKPVVQRVPVPKLRALAKKKDVEQVDVAAIPLMPVPAQLEAEKDLQEQKKKLRHRKRDFGDIGAQASTVIHEAQYKRKTPPQYPRRALDLGQQGAVNLHVLVTPEGRPKELKIASSSGFRLLDQAAIAAVRKWEFIPTRNSAENVGSWVRVPVNFVIR